MKNLKTYSLRRNHAKSIIKKTMILSMISVSFFLAFWNLWLHTQQFLTDISWISKNELYKKAQTLKSSWTMWPFEQITDLSSSNIQKSSMTYAELRNKTWKQVPSSLKVSFPQEISSYINKYKNITLSNAWNVFKDPVQLDKFTFMRRIIRATRLASYNYKKIWIRWSWTHAWVDFISNTWTPIVSIADWLVVKKVFSRKWFWNYLAILHKISWKYYLSFYWHMEELSSSINVWDFVEKWKYIWSVWNTWNSFGSHLHLQINRVFTLQDIVNGRVMIWWYHDLQWVKEYTVDPIGLIEQHYNKKTVWDDLPNNQKMQNISNNVDTKKEDKTTKNISSKKQDSDDLIESITKELTTDSKKLHSVADSKAKITDLKLSLMDNKIQLGYAFTATISLKPWSWKIWIVLSNDNISSSESLIENPSKNEYKISFKARSLGETKIQFNDWYSSKTFDVRIYKASTEKVSGIKVKISKLSIIWSNKITIYPTNKFWQILNSKLNWTFKIYFEKDWKKNLLRTIFVDGTKFDWHLVWTDIWKWKLIVESEKFYAKQNIAVDIAKDYSYNSKYSNSIYKLVRSWVVKWDSWNLYPNRSLTRRELLTVLWRSVLKVDYEKAKTKMQNHIKNKWRFFKDIDGKAYSDPYIFVAWASKLAMWENSYSLANTKISKWELLTILTRLFKIKIKEDKLNSWKDLQPWALKAIADSSKKYWLYPFDNYNKFKSWEISTRVVAFETLQRFINYKDDWVKISSRASTKGDWLEDALNDIFDF